MNSMHKLCTCMKAMTAELTCPAVQLGVAAKSSSQQSCLCLPWTSHFQNVPAALCALQFPCQAPSAVLQRLPEKLCDQQEPVQPLGIMARKKAISA